MADPGRSGVPASHPPARIDTDRLVESLRVRGAERFDPVRFRFIEALARRSSACRGDARRFLDARLATLVSDYRERFERAEDKDHDALVRREGLGNTPLGELLAHIARQAADGGAGGAIPAADPVAEPQAELRSVRYFRSTWSRLSVDRQLSLAFAQAPENAGPLNSHFLVLQSLRQMRDISPEYLQQFMAYVDALLWLDQADAGRNATRKAGAKGAREKKGKSGRSRA